MKSPEERLTRLLDRHPEFYPVGSDLPSGAIIRRSEMLVPAEPRRCRRGGGPPVDRPAHRPRNRSAWPGSRCTATPMSPT